MNTILNKTQVFKVLDVHFKNYGKPMFKINTVASHDKVLFYRFMQSVSEYIIYHHTYTLSTRVRLDTWDMYYQKMTNIPNTDYSYIQFNTDEMEYYNKIIFDNNERVKFNYHVKNDNYEDIGYIHHDFTVRYKI